MEQQLLTLQEHMSVHPRSLVFMCMFCRSLFVLFLLAIELSLSFLDLRILNIPLVSSNSSYQYICAINSLNYNWDIFCLQCNIHCTNLNMRFTSHYINSSLIFFSGCSYIFQYRHKHSWPIISWMLWRHACLCIKSQYW